LPNLISEFGGLEKMVRDEMAFLEQRGIIVHTLSVVSFSYRPKTFSRKHFHCPNVINAFIWVKDNLDVGKYDLVHFHDPRGITTIALAGQFKYALKIITFHGSIFHSKKNPLRRFYFSCMITLAKLRVDIFLEAGFSIFQMLPDRNINKYLGLPVFKSLNQYNGVKDEDVRIFLCQGRIARSKNQLYVAKLFIAMDEILPGRSKLIISGFPFEKNYEEELINVIRDIPNIDYLPNCTDYQLNKLYSKSTFLISASMYEGFGISTYDGLMNGCIPVIYPFDKATFIYGVDVPHLTLNFKKDLNSIANLVLCEQHELKKLYEMIRLHTQMWERYGFNDVLGRILSLDCE